MRALIVRLVINAVALFVAARVVPGIAFTEGNWTTIVLVALIFGVVNAFVSPILKFLTCPVILLSLGLFTFVINALMLLLTSAIADALKLGFLVRDFGAAFWGALIISFVSFLMSWLVKEDDRR
ncbi:MAG: phage holin family protein [Chloroflexi bacterium]|nr:phage holin family protein [Chloroflexota bacterium]